MDPTGSSDTHQLFRILAKPRVRANPKLRTAFFSDYPTPVAILKIQKSLFCKTFCAEVWQCAGDTEG